MLGFGCAGCAGFKGAFRSLSQNMEKLLPTDVVTALFFLRVDLLVCSNR